MAKLVRAYRTAQESFKAKRWSEAIEAAIYAKELAQGGPRSTAGDPPFRLVPLHVLVMRLEEIVMHSAIHMGSLNQGEQALRAARAISPFYELMCPLVRLSAVCSCCRWYGVLPCAHMPAFVPYCCEI